MKKTFQTATTETTNPSARQTTIANTTVAITDSMCQGALRGPTTCETRTRTYPETPTNFPIRDFPEINSV